MEDLHERGEIVRYRRIATWEMEVSTMFHSNDHLQDRIDGDQYAATPT